MTGYTLASLDVTPPAIPFTFISTYVACCGGTCLIVDPGPSTTAVHVARLLVELSWKWGRKAVIAVTHVHVDHASGAGLLARLLSDRGWTVSLRVHPRGAPHLIEPTKLWKASLEALGDTAYIYGYPYPAPEDAVSETSDGETESCGCMEVTYLHTPGHASHHQSLLLSIAGRRILFTGDAAGMYSSQTGGIMPTTPPPFHPDKYMASLDRLAKTAADSGVETVAPTHNSPAPSSLLDRHRAQMSRWLEEARGFEGSPAEFLEHMVRVDDYAARAYMLFSRSRHTIRTMLHTAEGVLAAIRAKHP